jgi:hypothetical protein
VVRRAVGTSSDQPGARNQHPGNAVNLRRLQRLLKRERRQDCGHALGEHRLARPGRPNHQDIVAPGARDLDGTLGRLLSAYILEVHKELLGLAQQRLTIRFDRSATIPEFTKWITSSSERTG